MNSAVHAVGLKRFDRRGQSLGGKTVALQVSATAAVRVGRDIASRCVSWLTRNCLEHRDVYTSAKRLDKFVKNLSDHGESEDYLRKVTGRTEGWRHAWGEKSSFYRSVTVSGYLSIHPPTNTSGQGKVFESSSGLASPRLLLPMKGSRHFSMLLDSNPNSKHPPPNQNVRHTQTPSSPFSHCC